MLHSATDLERTGCHRYYAFWHRGPELGYEREPKGESLALGIELHEIAENYLVQGSKPDRLTVAGDMFIQALGLLPPPGAGGVEGEKNLKIAGHEYFMKVDYRGPLPEQTGIWTMDHKTSKSPKRYGLWQKHTTGTGYAEKKGFLDNIQAVIYGAQYVAETGEETAQLRWLYYSNPRGGAFASDIVLEKAEIWEAFGTLVHPTAELAATLRADKRHPLELDPNPGRCHAYGRDCHYTTVCNLSMSHKLEHADKLTKIRKKEDMGLLERTQAKLNGTAPATAPAAETKKEDKINPTEAKSAKADIAPKSANVDTKPNNVTTDLDALAIFADRLGDALKLIAADLRK